MRREYFSSGLSVGLTYRYVVRAQVQRDGKLLERTETLSLSPGDNKSLALDFSGKDASQYAIVH